MKKKFLATVMMGAMVLALAACGADADVQTQDTSNAEQNVEQDADQNEEADVTEDEAEAEDTEVDADVDSDDEADADVDEESDAPDFAGVWAEEIAGRCTITIDSTGENTYDISIHWGSSAFESANWEMSGEYNEATGALEYTDAKYSIITFEDEENFTEDVVYTDGTGKIYFEDDRLCWESDKSDEDGVTGENVFVNAN